MASLLQILTDKGSFDLEVGSDREFYVTRQIHDLHNFETKNGDFSKTLSIPSTPTNNHILDAYVGASGNTKNTVPCSVIMDGITIASQAELLFTRTVISNEATYFDITILYGNSSVFDAIKDGTIDELSWTDLSYDMSDIDTAVELSQNTTNLALPLCDWVNRSSLSIHEDPATTPTLFFELNIMGFFMYAKEIMTRIFEEAGFTVTYSSTIPSDFFKIALAAPVSKRFEIASVGQLSFNNSVSSTVGQAAQNEILPLVFANVINNSSTWWSIADQWWDVGTATELKVNVQGTYAYIEIGIRPPSEVRIMLNATTILATLLIDESAPAGTPFFLTAQFNAIVGDIITVEIESFVTQTSLTIETGTVFQVNTPGADTSPIIQPSEWLPQLGKADFIANILKLFNLVMTSNSISKEITITSFDDVYTAPEQDLTQYLDAGEKEITITNGIGSLGQHSWFKWQEDDIIRRNANHVIDFENLILEKEVDSIVMEFSAADNSILHFSPAVDTFLKVKIPSVAITNSPSEYFIEMFIEVDGRFEFVVAAKPTWNVGDYFAIYNGTSNEYYRVISKEDDRNGHVQTPVNPGFVGALTVVNIRTCSAEDVEPRLAILRTDGGEDNYLPVNGTTYGATTTYDTNSLTATWMDSLLMENITGTYYQKILSALQAPEIIKAWFNIPTALFVQIDFLRPVYVATFNGQYYINRISQFRPNQKVQIELVRITNFE
jgi:hypothetical protein